MSIEKNVFLLPFAGGSSLLFNKWKLDNYTLHAVEYSGHGFRYRESLAHNMADIIDDVICQIERATRSDYFLFGHSMGALIAWLVAQKIERKPKILFISACEPPECIDVEKYKRYQNDDALMQYINDYGRVSDRQRTSKVFRKILFPVIQNDFKILSEYVYGPFNVSDVPITVLYSKDDTLMRYTMMEKWRKLSADVHFEQLKGDHFYLEEEQNRKKILEIMEREMSSV